MTPAADSSHSDTQAYLPDFCAASTLFIVLLIAELIAILLTLAAYDTQGRFLIELSKISMLVIWVALLGSAVLCHLRNRLEEAGKPLLSSFASWSL